ncbi:MAG: helix-turn-helix transcriptional regulator [Selenomonadaceae bacterium]|nr:helix-turn-helix transcriptional regulator [Selenomonadaceae bacterium]
MRHCISDESFNNTGFAYTWTLIKGKYKVRVLYALMEFEIVRYGEMKRYIDPISHKMLSSTLRELETDGLIHRHDYNQLPFKVEYSLTPRGRSLIPLLDLMCQWGDDHRHDEPRDIT